MRQVRCLSSSFLCFQLLSQHLNVSYFNSSRAFPPQLQHVQLRKLPEPSTKEGVPGGAAAHGAAARRAASGTDSTAGINQQQGWRGFNDIPHLNGR
jgi:hypothetical protein